ncbi:MAG TPA: sigma 54-interacting transcriptional regulator, partial [Nitrospira sp.]|nr:sigma 54-interacting transcriptional regulator [Nitrospira sp.]
VSYMGVPLFNEEGDILGHMAVIDRRPIPEEPRVHAIFTIFAARAAAELRRLRAEEEVRAREEKVGRLLGSAMDAIIELDDHMRVTSANPASEKAFQCTADKMIGQDFRQFLTDNDARRLLALIADLDHRPEGQRSCWVSGGLTARCPGGRSFPAEATLARYESHHQRFTTLILRNVRDRIEAEQQIQSLQEEREILREELEALHKDSALIGDSPALTHVLRDINQVAMTDATVLIIGETGTGKELVARAIHAASQRRDRPLITVNCAAIPATLIESEFFGHEPGAFTGATKKREGRFALADKGTIFLDEIGELPIELQPKLLRVLQEGEYDSVGGSTTRKADVRVLAATNRDLAKAVKEGRFRQDLFYRLNVFPIHVPPLRERGDDVVSLATAFAERYATKLGRTAATLSPDAVRRLKTYHWPGNVRELQNVIERAVITATNDTLNLARALPEVEASRIGVEHPAESMPVTIRTAQEFEELERANILKALQSANWKVSGDQGAARLLGMNPSTLASRMKALHIKKPL